MKIIRSLRGQNVYLCFCPFPQALSVGIFPYILKLLASKLRELQPILVFIWAKILAVDPVSVFTTLLLALSDCT